MSGCGNDGREYVRVGKTTGGNISRVSKMTVGYTSGRKIVRIPHNNHRSEAVEGLARAGY